MQNKYIFDFINILLNQLFQEFNITTVFLVEVPKEWHINLNYHKE